MAFYGFDLTEWRFLIGCEIKITPIAEQAFNPGPDVFAGCLGIPYLKQNGWTMIEQWSHAFYDLRLMSLNVNFNLETDGAQVPAAPQTWIALRIRQ